MSMWTDYKKELEGRSAIETDYGFIVYDFYENQDVYLEEIYVKPEHRRKKAATELVDMVIEIAKLKGSKNVWASIVPSKNNPTSSMEAHIAYGFKIKAASENMIWMIKEIK